MPPVPSTRLTSSRMLPTELPPPLPCVAFAESVPSMLPEVLYDLAVIRLAAGDADGAAVALRRCVVLNPKLAQAARKDSDLEGLGKLREEIASDPSSDR